MRRQTSARCGERACRLFVGRERRGRLLRAVERDQLALRERVFAVLWQPRADEADHRLACGTARLGEELVAAVGLDDLVPQIEQRTLARGEVRARCPRALEVL